MKFTLLPLAFCLLLSCRNPSESLSETDVTQVDHSAVKQQSIGNCWLYAQGSWLESLLKSSEGREIDVSETYWEYWDLFEKLMGFQETGEDGLSTGGSWGRSRRLVEAYGWVEEDDFVAAEGDMIRAESQACAETYLVRETTTGGRLDPGKPRAADQVKKELNRAFSCEGSYEIDIESAFRKRHKADETFLKDPKSGVAKSLTRTFREWKEVDNFDSGAWSSFEGKKLPSEASMAIYRNLEQRIKKALNDHQPVVLSFYVSFNAPNDEGLFNLNSLAKKGQLGRGGGHMLVLHDYVVDHVPTLGRIGEGEVDDASKDLAILGELDYVVAKNSWGHDRDDRPWLKDGYSRISWDYLTKTYFDEETKSFLPFLQSVVIPPGY